MSKFKMIQLTNSNIGAVAANAFIPLGNVTRRIDCDRCNTTFTVASSASDTVVLNAAGYYKVTYSITAVATNAGVNNITLVANGTDVYSVGATAAAAGDTINLTLPFVVRVYPQCNNMASNNPMSIQITADDAFTSATANMVIEKIY